MSFTAGWLAGWLAGWKSSRSLPPRRLDSAKSFPPFHTSEHASRTINLLFTVTNSVSSPHHHHHLYTFSCFLSPSLDKVFVSHTLCLVLSSAPASHNPPFGAFVLFLSRFTRRLSRVLPPFINRNALASDASSHRGPSLAAKTPAVSTRRQTNPRCKRFSCSSF